MHQLKVVAVHDAISLTLSARLSGILDEVVHFNLSSLVHPDHGESEADEDGAHHELSEG
jgi:hypothetical protein